MKKPNTWGLYDMYGNVGEFCLDYTSNGRDYSDGSDVIDPFGYNRDVTDVNKYRLVRGGRYNSDALSCRSAARSDEYPRNAARTIGFRVWMRPQAYVK